MSEPTYTCAVWYLDDYGQINYELAETEEEAADHAAWANGDGLVLGLQRADGSTMPAGEWAAFADALRRQRELDDQRRNNPPPPIPTLRARDPFKGYALDIEVDEPGWLGDRRG